MDNPPLKMHYLKISQIKKMSDDEVLFVNTNYQRGKIWRPKQKKKLIESIMKGSPIGALTIWQNGSKMEILDGQQRINSIVTFLNNEFENNLEKKFQDLSAISKEYFQDYVIPCLQVMSTKEGDVSAIFVRLQEGTPLNIAEKTHALTGEFKNEFMDIFNNNPLFFKNFSNKRLRATLIAAQFLALELKVNFEDEYPELNYEDFVKLNDVEYKDGIPESRIKSCDENIQFMYATLYNLLRKISPRDIISIYMLTSYIRYSTKDYIRLGEQFREFVTMVKYELDRFSIYTKELPEGMSQETFDDYMGYKVIARKAATSDSLKKRFDFFLEKWEKFKPKILDSDMKTKDFKKVPNYLPDELATKRFEDILKENETIYLEFKEFVFNMPRKTGSNYSKYSMKIVETLSAFLNTDGGLLVLGVNPEKKLIGLEEDFQRLPKEKNWKGWEQEFFNMVEKIIGSQFNGFWKLEKIQHGGRTFGLVKIKKSVDPVYIKNGTTKFYTRYFDKNRNLTSKNRSRYIDIVFR